jgi:probable F420-dependent oxidoreductase
VKFGITFGRLNPVFFQDAAVEADRLGFDSVWMPEHLVFTQQMSRSPHPGEEHPPVPPDTPIYDAFAYLAFVAAQTERVRLGTHVYNIGLRHPFTAARGAQTVDLVSNGRFIFGIGASWLEEEWRVTQLDFATRGRRVDEAIDVCKRLWSEPVVDHHGEFFDFDGVVFEPKPKQQGGPPIVVGGESKAALKRAARLGDGWIGMDHTFESGAAQIAALRKLLEQHDRNAATFDFICSGPLDSPDDMKRWEDIGVTRMIVSPWRRSKEAVDGMRRFAETFFG